MQVTKIRFVPSAGGVSPAGIEVDYLDHHKREVRMFITAHPAVLHCARKSSPEAMYKTIAGGMMVEAFRQVELDMYELLAEAFQELERKYAAREANPN